MAQLQVRGARFSWTTALALFQFTYLLLGATVFQLLEKEAESQNRNHFQIEKLNFLANYTCLDGPALEKFVKIILDAWEHGVNPSGNSTNPSNWDFGSSFFFAGTVVTTIGYGNLSPTTYSGQVFCVFYALCGIPLNLAFLNQLSKCLTLHLGRLERSMISVVPHKQCVEVLAVVLFLLMGSVLFLVFPPLIFSYVEGWSYGEGFYYAFITLSTIGFGDYVVGNGQNKQNVSVYRSLAAVWIIFALAWLALILNIGARIMEYFLCFQQLSVTPGDEHRPSEGKQEDGLSTPEMRSSENGKGKYFIKIRAA
ncbi:potassium channel subfamily K member 16-like [Trichomycterus rosablanca]|uniref:potassium channel subfamily K member 16-like n=1 Tax=Trichomycterus rosablanca TaxID=2290929 RepID=UPI002F359079